jgi:hypothetical protein
MKEKFRDSTFRKSSLDQITLINRIVEDYQRQGYDLSLRQLYYQLVAGGHIANSEKSYKHIGVLVGNGRLAGLIDWNAINDRTRIFHDNTGDFHGAYRIDIKNAVQREIEDCFGSHMWSRQPFHVEVWVEKDALSEVVSAAAKERDVAYFACRGFASLSVLYEAAERLKRWHDREGKNCVILYLGDHDPSGIEMTRDIGDKLSMFGATADVRRIALSLDQIRTYNLPPNPAKETDSRFQGYIERYGPESWELDALKPQVLHNLIVETISEYYDEGISAENAEEMETYKREQWERYSGILAFIDEQTA